MTVTHEKGDEIDSLTVGHGMQDSFERLLWWLFEESTGASTRKLVLFSIKEKPRNAQQLSQHLGLDYTTVRHHLRVLEANKLVVAQGEKYGRIYFVSEAMESYWDRLGSIDKGRKGTKRRAGN